MIPIILSGGNGTRLWPMSRQNKPKQFISFIDNETMFTQTIKRFNDKAVFSDPIILGNVKHEELIQEEIDHNHLKNSEIILEPKARNTAPAIAAVIDYLHNNKKDDEIVIFLPSDAYINSPVDFEKYILEGAKIAEDDRVVCFGIQPLYPETGYGYIKLGKEISDNGFLVDKFMEKPNLETAVKFLDEGGYLWNAGIFMSKVSVLYKLFKNLQRELFDNIEETVKNSKKLGNRVYLDKDLFVKSEEISIDYAIIEKLNSKELAVVSMNIVWSDLGSYKSLYDIDKNKTPDQNIVNGKAILNNTKNCFIKSLQKTICCSDVEDLVIVEDSDIILVMRKDQSQNVKKLIEKCKEENMEYIL